MIELRNLELRIQGRPLLDKASVIFHPGWKVGVVGRNGCGKSTLFKLLLGQFHEEGGEVRLPAKRNIAHVAQETPSTAQAALDYVLDGDVELRELERSIAAAEQSGDGAAIAGLHSLMAAIDGYAAKARAAKILSGLGFAGDAIERPVADFSGGWRMRLNLARALVCRSDLLLLDEPTNHLDLDAVIWLETWLRHYPGTLLLISHDRDLLDRVVDHVAHFFETKLTLYTGNYGDFERMRAEKLAQEQTLAARQTREVAHLRSFIDRFRAQATKARQVQSRIKALERMEMVAISRADSPFHFTFFPPEGCPNPLLHLEKVSLGYGATPTLSGIELPLEPGQRIGLLGRNGAGKSTLVKGLAGDLLPLKGLRKEGPGLAIGYFTQHTLESLDPAATPFDHIARIAPGALPQQIRDFLGCYGFTGDDALRLVGPFSGGEKARLALALVVWRRPHLLLLDEPTNHLDLAMRDALTLALQEFEGALVVVSHDRHLLRAVTDQFYLVDSGAVTPFEGDLDDYARWLSEGGTQEREGDEPSTLSRKDEKRLEAQARAALAAKTKPLKQRLVKLEASVERLSTRKGEIEQALSDPAIYEGAGGAKLPDLLKEQGRIVKELEEAEVAWMEVSEALEVAVGEGG
ncbi:MAG: ABC transporter ATP-binding protein [Alphaproteobacteria bacterium CG_4_10_14_0_2_um_filter_63_37]|nr:MAG: ABC transporter ATP-binding protein [Proteobacteria bacterium CG1_02_64_396]PJA25708.1 MAG: ABC transporter ATP-binding protein [Alphaproteobacteria bacterium CG_4_10_14_0_2_um_filter_63_37]